jgi:transcriptional regulator with XRE-family HTH domain
MDEDFGQKVRREREARGWSQERLALEAGTTQSTIERIENRITRRSRFRLEVAQVLGIELRAFPTTRNPSANATPPEPPTLPLGPGGSETRDTQLMDIPHTRAQLEILESQIVREVAEVAIRKVYWLLLERRPTDDEERVLVGFAIEDYEAQKGQRVELAKVASQTRLEVEDRKADKASERGSGLS